MVEENTTTCACQGGWMCPNCADQHRAEISRLKAELSEAKSIINDLTGRHGMQTGDMSGNSFEWRTKYTIIERQLAEARAENEALKRVVSSTERWEKLDGQLQQARQEAARECIKMVKRQAPPLIAHSITAAIMTEFGLEG